jgi:hypothetical protein
VTDMEKQITSINEWRYTVGREDVASFTLLLWVTGWNGKSERCAHTYVLVCSLVFLENWMENHRIFAVRTMS